MKDGNRNTNREAKRIELMKIRNAVIGAQGMNLHSRKKLEEWLDTSINGLEHVEYGDLCIKDTNVDLVVDYLVQAFEMIQGAIESIDDDDFANEWRCPFSNRIMHKSLKLNELRKSIIFAQKKLYESLGHVVTFPASYLTEEIEEFGESDFKFNFHK